MTKEYKTYLQSKEWAQIKIALFEKRGKKCEKCGSVKFLHIHHLTYANIFNEEPEDLMILCSICHKKEHDIIDKKKVTSKQKRQRKKNKGVDPLIRRSKKIFYLNKKIKNLNKKYRNGTINNSTLSVNVSDIRKAIKKLEGY